MQYKINSLTIDQVQNMIAAADDRINNQIRVTKEGNVYVSTDIGASNISDLKFRYETYLAGNGYVGPKAAADNTYIQNLYKQLRKDWKLGNSGYIDY